MGELVPIWEGSFPTFQHWVNHATRYLAGRRGTVGEKLPAICVDSIGRRCNVGADFMRADKESTFPVRFFWHMQLKP
jgi:hypothetical protein